MNLHHLLRQREAQQRPLRVGLIGAGKFGSMYLSQARATPGMQVVAVADLSPERARAALQTTGWSAERYAAASLQEAVKRGTTHVTEDAAAMIAAPEIEIVIDATGNPSAGIQHVLACCEHGKSVVMVNVEADALAGPLLARRAEAAGIEMAAVANATGLAPAPGGLEFPPCGVDDLARVLRPGADGGRLHHSGQVEVVSSLERDGKPVFRDLRWGVYVTFRGDGPYVERCFREYGLVTDDSGRYTAMYKPFHLIGLELGISVASVGLRREPTGVARGWRGDVVATAKRDLREGEVLDGEGGYTVYGKLMPAADSLRSGGLPLGLAHGVRLKRAIVAGQPIRWSDVAIDENDPAVRFRREMERVFTPR